MLLALLLFAADWPQWRGPNRDAVSQEAGLLKEWPKGGPKLLWSVEGLGDGYATPSVAGGKLFVMGSLKGEEFVHALSVKDGKTLWSTKAGKVGETGSQTQVLALNPPPAKESGEIIEDEDTNETVEKIVAWLDERKLI